jgi:hypothetical protein
MRISSSAEKFPAVEKSKKGYSRLLQGTKKI